MFQLCTFSKNPFWWITNENITTDVAMITFLIGNDVVDEFEQPFLISFHSHYDIHSWIPLHRATTPRQAIPAAIEGSAFETIAMFRIDVLRQQRYVVEFPELTADDIFDIYVSDGIKPTLDEFKEKSTEVNQTNIMISILDKHDFDSWHYLCILPSERMAAITSNLERIDCLCHHSSTLFGRITPNYVREEITKQFEEQELELQVDFIIFIHVAVSFLIYCILLMIISLTNWGLESQRGIYFLSDIPGSCRYGYIIIVKTGNHFNAGTTSNIVIKLYGNKAESKEHVLNFPDPDKRILQRNQEDWFFLGTENHLGQIEKIDIWFDCWATNRHGNYLVKKYCSEIEVVDLQNNKYWWFTIERRFEISTKETYFHTAVPKKVEERVENRKFPLERPSFGKNPIWNFFMHRGVTFSNYKKLTIMLSIFVTTYAIVLFLYGSPQLRNSDSLGQHLQYGFHAQLIWVTIVGAVITFLIHLPIVHFSRFPCQIEGNEKGRRRINRYLSPNLVFWYLLVSLVIVSMTALLILGFWVPHVTVLFWLTSVMASLLIYIVLLENAVLVVYNFTMDRTERVRRVLFRIKSVLAFIEAQRASVLHAYGAESLRPYYEHLYSPLSRSKIKEKKYWAQIKEKLLDIILDIIMITIYVVLLYAVILKERDPITQKGNQEVFDLIRGNHSRTMSQQSMISDIEEIEGYIENTLIFSMQSPQWYGRFLSEDPGLTIDNNNKYIGIARLRQHRSNNHSCVVPSRMRFVTNTCIPPFDLGPEYGDFSEWWSNDTESDEFARMDSVWNYKEYNRTGTFEYLGKQIIMKIYLSKENRIA
ncbi:hypothetical protein JTB14_018868 [Gonioctena quinquepunctata]|nr:hypothetical protein JTB14_018868 [Gonioctena quinquepunctata]